jgi:uncharacterized protein YjbI with pentapeptide repeats
MANKRHLAKLKKGVRAWNEWRKARPEAIPDLSEADFSLADLSGVNLSGANLSQTDFELADLSNACLRGANLTGANLIDANLTGADLCSSNLCEASLNGTIFFLADLADTDLTRAVLGTVFADCDLSTTKSLEAVEHFGPSSIGIDTIYKSEGKIPISFLRGAGVPENLLTYIPSLTAPGAIQFYSSFISYSTKDQEFADRLYADLQDKGVRCWFAPHDVQGGKKLHEQIDDAIRLHERLLLILSPHSMESEWVKTEIRKARKRERTEKKRVLFPVRLVPFDAIRDWELFDADEGKDLAVEIREYYIPDFSEWKSHDSYQKEFEKLLRDLRTDASAPLSG